MGKGRETGVFRGGRQEHSDVGKPPVSKDPCPADRLYKKYGVSGLDSRKEYLATYKHGRVQELKRLIQLHAPKFVIFYSLGYLPEWTEIIGEMPKEITPQMYFVKKGDTAFCILPQGVAFGMSYKRLYEFAEIIKNKITLKASDKDGP